MGRMLDFMYEGDYHTNTTPHNLALNEVGGVADADHPATKLDVCSHLFCYAIGEHYRVERLSELALEKFTAAFDELTAEDFTDLVGVIASNTEADSVHRAMQAVAVARQDELAGCSSFMDTLSGKYLPDTPDGDAGDSILVGTLRTSKVLLMLGASLFRGANRKRLQLALEKDKLGEKCGNAFDQVAQLQRQVEKDMATLRMGEETHNGAIMAIRAAEEKAKTADRGLATANEASRKAKLEAEVLRMAEQNNKTALEKAMREVGALRERCQKMERETESLRTAKRESDNKLEQSTRLAQTRAPTMSQASPAKEDPRIAALKEQVVQSKRQEGAGGRKINELMNETADLKNRLVELVSANAELKKQMLSRSTALNARTERKQYIIDRITQLSNLLHECRGCGAGLSVALSQMALEHPNALDNELDVTCKYCNQLHTCAEYLHSA